MLYKNGFSQVALSAGKDFSNKKDISFIDDLKDLLKPLEFQNNLKIECRPGFIFPFENKYYKHSGILITQSLIDNYMVMLKIIQKNVFILAIEELGDTQKNKLLSIVSDCLRCIFYESNSYCAQISGCISPKDNTIYLNYHETFSEFPVRVLIDPNGVASIEYLKIDGRLPALNDKQNFKISFQNKDVIISNIVNLTSKQQLETISFLMKNKEIKQ